MYPNIASLLPPLFALSLVTRKYPIEYAVNCVLFSFGVYIFEVKEDMLILRTKESTTAACVCSEVEKKNAIALSMCLYPEIDKRSVKMAFIKLF